MAEDRDERTQEIALDELDERPRSGPPPLPSRRSTPPDVEPESSDRPTEPPAKMPGSKPPVRLGRSLVPPPLAAAVPPRVEAPRAETPRSSRATVKLKPITTEGAPGGEVSPPVARASVPPPLAGGLAARTERSTRELRRGPAPLETSASSSTSGASAPSASTPSASTPSTSTPSTSTPSTSAPSTSTPSTSTPSTSAPSTSAPSTPTPSASTPSASTPSTSTPSASTPSASTPSASTPSASTPSTSTPSASTPSTSSPPRSSSPLAPRPALATRPATERPLERATTSSLADAALQARLRHVETHVDELPKWTARIVALESDARFAELGARLDELERTLTHLHAKLDATVTSVASLLERQAQVERAHDEARARSERALDLATAAHEATRSFEARRRDDTERLDELARALRDVSAPAPQAVHEPDTAALAALEARLANLERASDGTVRARVEAMEARLVSLVARFADIAARAPGESGGRASLLPPPPPQPAAPPPDLEALVRELVQRELATRSNAEAPRGDGDELRRVKGIGPAFADRLRSHGVADVTTLAALDDERLEALAKAVGAPIAKLRKWRETARATS